MRFEIAKSLNGKKITYIARDTNGVVRLREDSLDSLKIAIERYNETLAKEAQSKKKLNKKEASESVSSGDEGSGTASTLALTNTVQEGSPAEDTPETGTDAKNKKEFLHSDIKEQIEDKKRRTSKKNFWDKLK